MQLTINFGAVALSNCPVFGALVYSENGWVPFSEGTEEECNWVREQVRGSPLAAAMPDGMRNAVFGKKEDTP